MRTPHTWFSTEFHGGARSVRRRLENLWCHKRGRWSAIWVAAFVCATALAGLLVSCGPAPAPSGGAPAISDEALARSAIDAAGGDWEGLEGAWRFLLDETVDGYRALALSFDSGVHAGGFGNLILFAADPETGALAGSPLLYPGDENDLSAWTEEDGLHVLFTTATTYQGVQTCQGGRLRFDGGAWTLLWPLEADTDGLGYDTYWADRKGVLTVGGMDLYTRGGWAPDPDHGDLPQWEYERTLLLRDVENGPSLDAARRYVAGVVPASAAGNAEFQITGFRPAASFPSTAQGLLDVDAVGAYALSYRCKEVGQTWAEAVEGPQDLYLFCALSEPIWGSSRQFAYLLGCSALPDASEADLRAAAERMEATRDPLADWSVSPGDAVPYTQADVESAAQAALAYFDALPDNRLDRLWFDPAALDASRQTYLRGGRGSVNGVDPSDVMILFCDWTWLGPDAVMDHGEQRTGWNLIFIREGPQAPWVLDDQGY